MKRRHNKNDKTNPKEDFFEAIKTIKIRIIVFTVLAFVVFIAGNFSWWAGFILYIILAVYLLSEFLINGFVFLVGVFLGVAYLFLKLKNKSLKSKYEKDVYYNLLSTLLFGIFCLFLLTLGVSLFVFFFPNLFLW